ncbi:MAG TPA: hypothetical protein VIL85_29930 [Thermomicrobiales bacterium]|jgi:hypothetical protein
MRGSKQDLPVVFEAGPMSTRQAEWGGMNVAIETAPTGADSTPLLKGLPDDRCQCPHWGYVISGKMRVKYADREELMVAGDAYYLAPGHSVFCEEAGSIVEFSPQDQYQQTMEVMFRNMQALGEH